MNYKKYIAKIIFILLIIPACSHADTKTRTVTATGKGEIFIPQTIANVQLSVSEDGKTAIDAQNKVRAKSTKLLDALNKEKTLNMETTSITVNPVMSYTDNKPKIIAYNAGYTVQVKAAIGNIGNIIDHAIAAGASIVNEPRLTASDVDIANGEKEAIKLATLDAKNKAQAALSSLGFKGITVSQITVQNNNNHPQPFTMNLMRTDNSASIPPTQIVSGKENITAEVNLTMEY